jgi:hypothetical protein
VVLNDYLDEAKPLHLDMFVAHVLPHWNVGLFVLYDTIYNKLMLFIRKYNTETCKM